jgi:hypothetical protein
MPNETLALAIKPPAAPSEDDFLTLCAALSESGRGRAFLAEYARRNRNADTEALLAAIGRVEARLHADASSVQRLRDDLRMLLIAIRLARPVIDAADPATRPAKLTKLLDLLERRIDAMAEVKSADVMPDEPEPARAQLAVVAPPDEPELPIPSPASFQPRPISLGHDHEKTSAPTVPALIEAGVTAPAPDPLVAIMALSDDERLALFT